MSAKPGQKGSGNALLIGVGAVVAVFALMVALVFAGAGLAVVALMGGAQGQQCGTVVAPVGDGSARLPVVGPYVVTSEFGMRFHPTEHVWKLHKGIDLAIIGNGGQVVAALGGTVVSAGWAGSGGNTVTL